MTEEEVQQIYDYLHENYRYKNGELMTIKRMKGKNIDEKIGCLHTSATGKTKINCTINIHGKTFFMGLGQLIWIYFNKEYIKILGYKDNNYINNNIDNLYKSSYYEKNAKSYNDCRIYKGEKKGYQVRLSLNGKSIYLGVHENKEKAKIINEKAIYLYEQGLNLSEIKNELIKDGLYKPKLNKILKGVYKNHNNYMAQITLNGKKKYLGTFCKPEEAHAAYLKAKEEYAKKA
jgi:hypothetical protein